MGIPEGPGYLWRVGGNPARRGVFGSKKASFLGIWAQRESGLRAVSRQQIAALVQVVPLDSPARQSEPATKIGLSSRFATLWILMDIKAEWKAMFSLETLFREKGNAMKKRSVVRLSVVFASLLGTVGVAFAQQAPAPAKRVDLGKAEYEARCATCHGLTGKGDGPMATHLNRKVPDLTTLAKNNNGILPATAMYLVITGDRELPAHGTRDMPVWGNAYRLEAAQHLYEWPYDIEGYVRARILTLIEYIDRLQAR